MYRSDDIDFDSDGVCEGCGKVLSVGIHICHLMIDAEPKRRKKRGAPKTAPPPVEGQRDLGWADKDPFSDDMTPRKEREDFLESERARLLRKLEAIESLTKLGLLLAKTNIGEVEEILRQINFHSR